MRRVLVVGCAGAGKSTFSRQLAERTGLPLVSLDAEFWQPDWKPMPRDLWRPKVGQLSAAETWIQDGNFDGTLDVRLPLADTIVWFDLPRRICMWRVLKRIALGYGEVRPEMAPGCPERLDPEFLHYVWTFNTAHRPRIGTALAAHGAHLTPVIIRHDADAARFLDSARHRESNQRH